MNPVAIETLADFATDPVISDDGWCLIVDMVYADELDALCGDWPVT